MIYWKHFDGHSRLYSRDFLVAELSQNVHGEWYIAEPATAAGEVFAKREDAERCAEERWA